MIRRCLIIADDLTGGADAGVKFAKRGLSTFLISLKDDSKVDLTKYTHWEVLVINTDSRGLSPGKAFFSVSSLLKGYDDELFPIIFKKIDSTLRGNIGYEIDAILNETNCFICFMAPSYPQQDRILVGGIMIVGGKPLSLTEATYDTVAPVLESYVYKLLERQSLYKIGRVDLTHVASSTDQLLNTVDEEWIKGNKIIIFDAVSRRDLANVADVAFCLDRKPLLVGSAGLAEEVAKKLSPPNTNLYQSFQKVTKPLNHIFIISGSTSSVTHEQIKRVMGKNISAFQLNKSLVTSDDTKVQIEKEKLSKKIAHSLSRGHAILKTHSQILRPKNSSDLSIPLRITKTLASIALLALEESKVDTHDLALILTGGDTAVSVINGLGSEGIEIERELLEGIVKGHLIGGNWDGLTVITKAGAFGKENALEKVTETLETESPAPEKETCF
jgi:uncharacterized protein YgbK (DUF1537 family)